MEVSKAGMLLCQHYCSRYVTKRIYNRDLSDKAQEATQYQKIANTELKNMTFISELESGLLVCFAHTTNLVLSFGDPQTYRYK